MVKERSVVQVTSTSGRYYCFSQSNPVKKLVEEVEVLVILAVEVAVKCSSSASVQSRRSDTAASSPSKVVAVKCSLPVQS